MTDSDQLTQEIGHALRDRTDAMLGASVSFDGVRGRARSIRRRRAAGTAGAVAAAVAVVLVVPTLLGGADAPRSDRPQPAPPASGPVPRPAVLHAGSFTLPDGTERDLGIGQDVGSFGVLSDGRLVVTDRARSRIEVYDGSSLTATYPVDLLSLTMSSTHRVAAWVDQDWQVQVLESGRAEPVQLAPVPLPGETVPVIDAVVGSDCASGGCRVLAGEGNLTVAETDVDGAEDLGTGEDLRITDVSADERTWAVSFPPEDGEQYGCVGLYDVASTTVTARSCTTANLRFSPDGRHVVGGYVENGASARVSVLDRGLRPVRVYAPDQRVVSGATWADDTHLLAAVAGVYGRGWTLESVDIGDGASSTLGGPDDGVPPESGTEFLFSQ